MFAGACSHSFSELLTRSIARSLVEIAHLYRFVFADGRRIGQPEFDDIEQGFIHGVATKLGTLTLGEQFVYEFDFGDSWTHLCTVAPTRIDLATKLGIIPSGPLPALGVETIPDQYGRHWADDDEDHDEPPNPGSDLSPAAHDGAHNYWAKRPCRWQPRTVRTRLVRGR
jgi:hypothetical protein